MIFHIFQKFCIFFFIIFSLSSCSNYLTNQTIQKKTEEVHVDVAIMLPLSGKDGRQSMTLLKLIKQGLEDGAKARITPITYDCTTENMSIAAINDIASKKIKIIIGPLFSSTTSLIKEKAKKNGITILTLSNNPALADSYTYVFGHAPVKQMERLISYHLDNKYNNYFVLLPNGGHSKNVSNIIGDMVASRDGTLVKSEFYSAYDDSINESIRRISDIVDMLNEDVDNDRKPVIYIGDYRENLPLLFDKFYEYNLDSKAEIIGDNRINIPFDRPMNLTYTGSMNVEDTNLKERFKFLVGAGSLNYLEGLAYDLGLVTANSIGSKFYVDEFHQRLDGSSGYMVVTGIVRFNKKIAERKYDIIKRIGKKHKIIDHAGNSF